MRYTYTHTYMLEIHNFNLIVDKYSIYAKRVYLKIT